MFHCISFEIEGEATKRHLCPRTAVPAAAALRSLLQRFMCCHQRSPRSNGLIIRCVGRSPHCCNDGCLNTLVTTLLAIFLSPLLLFQCCTSSRARRRLNKDRANTCWQLCACCGPKATDYSDIVKEACIRIVGDATHKQNKVTFVCLSDTHNRHRDLNALPMADVLVHTGDFTNFGTYKEVEDFVQWMGEQPHPIKIVVPGNHDMILDKLYWQDFWSDWSSEHFEGDHEQAKAMFQAHGITLLIDERLDVQVPVVHTKKHHDVSPTAIRGHGKINPAQTPLLNSAEPPAPPPTDATATAAASPSSTLSIYGSPWVTKYAAWNTAFNKVPVEMEQHWKTTTQRIQSHVQSGGHIDVLLTHMPPSGSGDMEPNGKQHGCPYLLNMVKQICPTVHVFGHVHSDAGWGTIVGKNGKQTQCLNAASVCDYYFLRPDPVTFEVSPVPANASVTMLGESNKKRK